MKFQKALAVYNLFFVMGFLAQPQITKADDQISLEASSFTEMAAGEYKCPAPTEVKCKAFAESVGPWTQNGGFKVSSNTSFVPNNQCANVIPINENGFSNRLLCCYKECGVLFQDVKFRNCKKVSVSEFRCQ